MITSLFGMANTDDVIAWVRDHGVEPLFMCVTGSHMWGLATSESDLDIRGIYIAPTDSILSIYPGRDTIEGQGQLGGLVDFQIYEIRKAFSMLLRNNGNCVEMLLSPTTFFSNGWDWQFIAEPFLTKQLANYYKGYYHSQRKRAMTNRGTKALVYTYREILAGIVLMRSGKIIYDFEALRNIFLSLHGDSLPLLEKYLHRSNWREPMSAEAVWEFEKDWTRLEELLDGETAISQLPDCYDGYETLNNLLLEIRRQH